MYINCLYKKILGAILKRFNNVFLTFGFIFLVAGICSLPAAKNDGQYNDHQGNEAGREKQKRAVELMNQGKYDQSLKTYLYLLNKGHRYGKEFNAYKRSFMLGDLKQLGDRYLPTRSAIENHLGDILKRLIASGYEEQTMDHVGSLADYFSLNSWLVNGFPETMGKIKDEVSRQEWGYQCFNALYRVRRIDWIVEHLDLVRYAEKHIKVLAGMAESKTEGLGLFFMAAEEIRKRLDLYISLYRERGKIEPIKDLDEWKKQIDKLVAEVEKRGRD
jgi:hypothetical protein